MNSVEGLSSIADGSGESSYGILMLAFWHDSNSGCEADGGLVTH